MSDKRFIPLLLTFLIFALLGQGAAQLKFSSQLASPDVLAEFDQLAHSIDLLSTLNKGQQTSLTQKLASAKDAYGRGQPCTALNILDAYLNEAQALRRGTLVATAEQLYDSGRILEHDLASRLPEGTQCPGHAWINSGISVELLESDNTHVHGHISFGELGMSSVLAGGQTFTRLTLPGLVPTGPAGLPGVPAVNRLLAFPRGAIVSVFTSPPLIADTLHLNVYPFQHEPADSETTTNPFADPPFVQDAVAYASPGPFPANICTVQPLGQVRDLPIAQLFCATGQYNPISNALTLFRSIDFEVRFAGGSGFFIAGARLGPFERPLGDDTRLLINERDIANWVDWHLAPFQCAGEELLIFTTADLASAAQKLAQWKQTHGIATAVVTIGNTWTGNDIRNYIQHDYDHCTVRPSYVLLFGDTDLVPTFYVGSEFAPINTASDYPYAAYPQFPLSLFPEFGVGRIPVGTLAPALDVVDKIIVYEAEPPTFVPFYQNVTLASAFECCDANASAFPVGVDLRGFIQTSESVRNLLMDNGYTVERIYTEIVDPCSPVNCYTNGNVTPTRYHDGTLLPADLGADSGFAWNGSTQDIISAWNDLLDPRFLIMHRDHGSWEHWAHPELTKDDIPKYLEITPYLPVVFSMNCSTGFFDPNTNPSSIRSLTDPTPYYPFGTAVKDETYFAERLLRQQLAGAIGVIAPTRDSPSWANDALARGLFDAVWPGVLGPGVPPQITRLGDILSHAKVYLFTAAAAPDLANSEAPLTEVLSELNLYHLLGDPTLAMWTLPPSSLPATPTSFDVLEGAFQVGYGVEGATITALQVRQIGDDVANWEMLPIGRARVKNGVATLSFVNQPWSDVPILLSASKLNAVSRPLTLPGGIGCPVCDVK